MWDVETGQVDHILKGHSKEVMVVAFSKDGRRLASGSRDHTIRIRDTVTGKEEHTLISHSSAILDIKFSTDGKTLVSCAKGEDTLVWDIATCQPELKLEDHSKGVSNIIFSSPDGLKLVDIAADGNIRLWDATTWQLERTFENGYVHIRCIKFSVDRTILASGSYGDTLLVWDVRTSLPILKGHIDIISFITFSPDACKLASGIRGYPSLGFGNQRRDAAA